MMEEDKMDIRETTANIKAGKLRTLIWQNMYVFIWIDWIGSIADIPLSAITTTRDKMEKELTKAESGQDED